jgi:hypothetical protein
LIMIVETWLRINYKNGDNYNNACKKSKRNAVVVLLCNPYNSDETFSLIEENTERDENCAYVFEIHAPFMCSSNSTNKNDNNDHKRSNSRGIFTIFFIL